MILAQVAPPALSGLGLARGSIKGIRRGLAQAKKGLGRSADEVFDALERDARDKFVSVAARRILERSKW